MADKFIDGEVFVCSDWLNVVDKAAFNALLEAETPGEALENIGAQPAAPVDGNPYVAKDGGWVLASSVIGSGGTGGGAALAKLVYQLEEDQTVVSNADPDINGTTAVLTPGTIVVINGIVAFPYDETLEVGQYTLDSDAGTVTLENGASDGDIMQLFIF
jgi:hypothetical protein